MEKSEYKRLVERRAARSPVLLNIVAAFFVGGSISLIGQALFFLYRSLGQAEDAAYLGVTITLVAASALATATGVFPRLARIAGGGTLLPVTGFANAITAAAIDTRSEGLVLGVGAKIFTVAGPVLLFATLGGTLYGAVYYLLGLLGVAA